MNEEFLVWLEDLSNWAKENFEDLEVPEYSGCSTYEKGVRKGKYEEKVFVGKALRHKIDAEIKKIQEEQKYRKEIESGE